MRDRAQIDGRVRKGLFIIRWPLWRCHAWWPRTDGRQAWEEANLAFEVMAFEATFGMGGDHA